MISRTFTPFASDNDYTMKFDYFMQLVREAVADHRNEKGMTQEALADRLCCSATSISNYETGKTDISFRRLFRICKVFGIDFFRLLERLLHEANLLYPTDR